MLLVAILVILSGQGSLVGMERFATRHLALLNEVLGLEIRKPPSDSTFRYLFLQLDVEAFEALLLHWMSQQPEGSCNSSRSPARSPAAGTKPVCAPRGECAHPGSP
jgi:hypothetical protein